MYQRRTFSTLTLTILSAEITREGIGVGMGWKSQRGVEPILASGLCPDVVTGRFA